MRPKTLEEQLERVLASLVINDCWEWGKAVQSNGYASTTIGSASGGSYSRIMVHRFVYQMLTGANIEGLHLDHLCKNRKCCNPDHLEPVSASVNVSRSAAGRWQTYKTHCPQGHDYKEYGYLSNKGHRLCRPCTRAANRKYYQKRREVA